QRPGRPPVAAGHAPGRGSGPRLGPAPETRAAPQRDALAAPGRARPVLVQRLPGDYGAAADVEPAGHDPAEPAAARPGDPGDRRGRVDGFTGEPAEHR